MDTSLSPTHGRSFGVQAPRTAELLAQGRAEFDQAKRVEIYKDMQRAALEEVPLVGLAWRSQGYGMDKQREGLHQPARRADDSPPASCWTRPGSSDDRCICEPPGAASLVLAWLVATIVFLALHLVPGDPAELLLSTGGVVARSGRGRRAARAPRARPAARSTQYRDFLAGLLRGDLGRSLVDDYPVASEIALRLPRTLELIARRRRCSRSSIGVPAGVYAAVHRGGRFDRISSAVAALLLAMPVFVVGTLLILLFAQTLRLMPAGGFVPFAAEPGAASRAAGAAGDRDRQGAHGDRVPHDARLACSTRCRAITCARRAPRACRRARVLVHHVVRNALTPVLTVLGLHMGALLGGTVLVEYVFNWPGLSTPLLRAVEARDYPMVVGIVLTISGLFLLINLIVELLYARARSAGHARADARLRGSSRRAGRGASSCSRWPRRCSACPIRSARTWRAASRRRAPTRCSAATSSAATCSRA